MGTQRILFNVRANLSRLREILERVALANDTTTGEKTVANTGNKVNDLLICNILVPSIVESLMTMFRFTTMPKLVFDFFVDENYGSTSK